MNCLPTYIRSEVRSRGMTLNGLSRVAEINKDHLYAICKRKARMKAKEAIVIGKALGCDPVMLMQLQAEDEILAEQLK